MTTAVPMECPYCRLHSPPEAQRCDCGYDFVSRSLEASYLSPGEVTAGRHLRGPEWRSFLVVPPVAAASWYVLMLAVIAYGNGRLRWRPDVLAFGLGVFVWGLPIATVVTVCLAVPLYVLVGSGNVSVGVALMGGGLIGGVVGLVGLIPGAEILSPARGVLIGLLSGLAWWWAWRRLASPAVRARG